MKASVHDHSPEPMPVEKDDRADNLPAVHALVRQAVPGDAEAIAAVHIASWQAAYRGQLPDTFLDGLAQQLPQRIDFWRQEISVPRTASHEIWVATLAEQLCGFVALGPARDENSRSTAEVYAIYIHPGSWRQGLGTMLLTHVTSRLATLGFFKAILWVLQSNTQARRFYEVAGWRIDGKNKVETLPGGIELREVRYQKTLGHTNEDPHP